MSEVLEPNVDIVLPPDGAATALVDDVRRCLGTMPRRLPPRWLYDEHGSRLFDRITRLPEYYPTDREREILRAGAADIARRSQASTLVELGSGTSDKTRVLLDAFTARGGLQRFVPVDVSAEILAEAAQRLSQEYPGLQVSAVVGDFTLHLGHLPKGGPRMVAFLGGTIGNFYVEERAAFLGALADHLDPGDTLLLGTDLVKPLDRLVAAYDDPGGVTSEFVKNVLVVVNRELGADFDVSAFSYIPLWDARMSRMDLRLRAEMPQRVRIPRADLTIDLAAGEEIQVEVSTKFRLDGVAAELTMAGFAVVEQYVDDQQDYALTLARRGAVRAAAPPAG